MSYREIPPPPTLREAVVCFWTRGPSVNPCHEEPSHSVAHRVVPDGCVDLIFSWQLDPITNLVSGPPKAFLSGIMTQSICFSSHGSTRWLGVRLRTGMARTLVKVPLHETTDVDLLLSDLFDCHVIAELSEKLSSLDLERGIELAAAYLETVFHSRSLKPDSSVMFAVRRISDSLGTCSILDITQELGLSRQHLARSFKRDVGLSPKHLARIFRIQNSMQMARQCRSPDWVHVSLACGYYDQSHFINDFSEIVGISPLGWLAEDRRQEVPNFQDFL